MMSQPSLPLRMLLASDGSVTPVLEASFRSAVVETRGNGLIVEVHPNPREALCDGPQALTTCEFPAYARAVHAFARAVRTPRPLTRRPETVPNHLEHHTPRRLVCHAVLSPC
jgi:hypothetical protein